MTKRKSKPVQYYNREDEDGFPSRVVVPAGGSPNEGIPIHLNLDAVYGHLPDEFLKALYQSLHDHGLVEPQDFMPPTAAKLFQRAVLSVIKNEFLKVQNLAREELQHGK